MLGSDWNAHFSAGSFLFAPQSACSSPRGVRYRALPAAVTVPVLAAEVAGRDLRLQPWDKWAMQTRGSWPVRTHLWKRQSIGRQGASFGFYGIKMRKN